MIRAAVLSVSLLLGGLGITPASAGDPSAPRVTSHSVEYCDWLVIRVNAMIYEARVPPPSDVVDLAAEGQRMCGQGQVRGGIMRLRRALMLIQQIADAR